jgi:hypothetical protein
MRQRSRFHGSVFHPKASGLFDGGLRLWQEIHLTFIIPNRHICA